MPAQFRIEQRLDYFSYTFTSDDVCILFFSRLYTSLPDCKRAIKLLQCCVGRPEQIEKAGDKGEYSFFIRDKKGNLLGHSIVFFAGSSRDYGIRKICLEASQATILEPAGSFNGDQQRTSTCVDMQRPLLPAINSIQSRD